MQYRLVALDMDGTLLNTQHQMTDYTRDVLCRAAVAGNVVALATGRCLSELVKVIHEMDAVQYIICENGACVYDVRNQTCIRQISIPREEVFYGLRALDDYDVIVQLFVNNQSYLCCGPEDDLRPYHVEEYRPVFQEGSLFEPDMLERCKRDGEHVEKVNIYFVSDAERIRYRNHMAGRPILLADSLGFGIEISPMSADKGMGLEVLCEHLHLPVECSMGIGDGGNDVGLMQRAGLSVAMGNALPAVIAAADVQTEDCDHDGAAKAIERYMLAGQDT